MLTAIFSLPLSANSMVNEYQEDGCADYDEDYDDYDEDYDDCDEAYDDYDEDYDDYDDDNDDNDDATGKQYSSKAELELRRDIFHANLVK